MDSKEREVSVWIDLEETIIDSWDNGYFTGHIPKIKKYVDSLNPPAINIWSFAIWDKSDCTEFVNSGMKERIENAFKRPIMEFPSVELMQQLCSSAEGHFIYESRMEFMQFNGKLWSFVKFAMVQQNMDFYLIDDAVPHMALHLPNRNTKIFTLNVDHDL